MTGPLLTITDLEVRRGPTAVLHDVSLTVQPGEIVAVLGPNGAGKSTLLDVIGGGLAPAAGQIERRGRIATAMQSPDLANRSAQANVELALSWWGVARRDRRDRATAALSALHAEQLASRWAAAMSGGERRRVHLARALALNADLLLLDEPFAGLDPATRGELLADAGEAFRSRAGAVIVVVHDRAEAWALADRLVVLINGTVAAAGPPRTVLEQPPSVAVAQFLGFTGELLGPDGRLLTRTSHVHLDGNGDLVGTVTRLVPLEDGARADVTTPHGQVSVVVGVPGPSVGDTVRLQVSGGVRFPLDGG